MDAEGLQKFLAVASEFKLGDLPTEQPHPLTGNLSRLSVENPAEALRLFHALDYKALEVLLRHLASLQTLAETIYSVFESGGSVFLTGCGSTGRLSLACESIWRKEKSGTPWADRVHAFMAGGDIAMIRSIESFEDHPEYGARQLEESGFGAQDLLIAITEGGETPFVIGAARRATEISSHCPYFLYCNPDEALMRVAARSAEIIADERIVKLCLATGPMALSGSTRLQASTVLMAAVGGALFAEGDRMRLEKWVRELITYWQALPTRFLVPFVEKESELYRQGRHLEYVSDSDLAITILTDTTERAPTFSMSPFNNDLEPGMPVCLCSFKLPVAAEREAAWKALLGRQPRGLEWEQIGAAASRTRLLGFDFSADRRPVSIGGAEPSPTFDIRLHEKGIRFHLGDAESCVPRRRLPMLSLHLILKMLLNAHSTLVMGRLGRFDGNLMTWVKPSNHKLIDRTIRYTDLLLRKKSITRTYEEIAAACFELKDRIPANRSLIMAMVDRLGSSERINAG